MKLNNRRGVLIDLYSQALSQRSGKTGYEGYTTCALGRMRVLGKDILDKTGDCIGLTGRNQSSDSTTIEKTFFTGKYSYPILVFSLDVDLKASGAIEAKYTSTALTGVPGANGVWWNGEKSYAKTVIGATADLRTRSQLSFGVPYVAGVAVEGSLSLIKLNFKPSQTSSRDTNIFTGTYKRSTSMPFELDGLDGRVRLIARGPLNSIIDKTTIWDPKPLVEYDRNLMNKTTSSTYNFVSY